VAAGRSRRKNDNICRKIILMAKKKSNTKKVKTAFALIRAKGADAELIENLKKYTHEKTNSGALMVAAKKHQYNQEWIKKLERDIELIKSSNENLLHMLKQVYRSKKMIDEFGKKWNL